jgi:predicted O-methyltransferase YrrM
MTNFTDKEIKEIYSGQYGLTDNHFMNWYREISVYPITQGDVTGARDVLYAQPILYFLCRTLNAQKIIEIGTDNGSTTIPLLKAAYENHGIVYSIDPASCESAKRLVSAFGYSNNWKFNQMKSDEFFSNYNDEIHFAWIDGLHTWPQVKKDVDNCLSRLVEGGIVMLHDIDGSPEQVYSESNPPSSGDTFNLMNHHTTKALQMILPKYPDVDFMAHYYRIRPKNLNNYVDETSTHNPYTGNVGYAILKKRYQDEKSLCPNLNSRVNLNMIHYPQGI